MAKGGAPCWFELSTTDAAAAQRFLGDVFGWTSESIDLGAMGPYSFLRNATGPVGALMGQTPDERAAGVPSHWSVYFHATDCAATAARAVAAGAVELLPTMTVDGQGRMAVLRDPTGAIFSLWEPLDAAAPGPVRFVDYSVGWVELATRDQRGAAAFYSALLGWELGESDLPIPGDLKYVYVGIDGVRHGGILPMTAEWGEMAPHWSIYVQVPDVDAIVAKAQAAGGSVCVPAFDAPGVGRIAMIADPTGAACYVITLRTRS